MHIWDDFPMNGWMIQTRRHTIPTEVHNYATNIFRGTWVHSLWNELQRIQMHLFHRSHGKRLLLEQYTRDAGKELNLTNPQSFSEKLYHRMITWIQKQDPIYTQLADKFSVRDYVARKAGEQHLVKLLWHGEDPSAIPFDALPAEFIIKTNHASAQVIFVKNVPDRDEIVRTLSGWLQTNYFFGGGEYQYYHIKPRVLIEEYLRNHDGTGPLDYRFWCFHGTPEVIQVDNHAHDINPFFDREWQLLDLHYREGAARPALPKPKNFECMLSLASKLSADFDFVRVDLYNVDGHIYFGELTFTPAGSLKLRPPIWDSKLGEKWKISSGSSYKPSETNHMPGEEQPSTISMPDLDDLNSLTTQLIVKLRDGSDLIFGQKTRLHLRTFIRLVDKSIGEYKAARTCLIREVKSEADRGSALILNFTFIDHIENCIMSARRVFRMIEQIRQANPDFVSIETIRLLESFSRQTGEIRNVIEPIDDDLHVDEIEPKQPVLLNLSSDKNSVSIGSQTLQLHPLGTALRKMHHLAKSLLDTTRS